MADPVIVSSGHTFERNCVKACISLNFIPVLPDGSSPDFSTIIPNLALKATIYNWCNSSLLNPPKPLDLYSAEKFVRKLVAASPNPRRDFEGYAKLLVVFGNNQLARTPSHLSTSSEESVAVAMNGSATPLCLTTRPSCYSSSSSSDIETLNPHSPEEDEFVTKLKSSQVFDQEEAVTSLRKLTRTKEETRTSFCTPRLLSALRPLITSRYSTIQVNSVAALVNFSLENQNKVMIVRSGIVPPLIDVMKGGFLEAQDHAAGALFSLALDDQNKTAIGVLGALPPLLRALRSASERARHDSALALYHLSLVQSNRIKLVKLGAIPVLLTMVKTGHMAARILLVLCSLASSVEGRGPMLDGGAVECFIGILDCDDPELQSTSQSVVTALYGLSHGGLRFKGLAKDANAEEILKKVEATLCERGKKKVTRILEILNEKDIEEEEVDWEELLNSDDSLSSGTASEGSHLDRKPG